MHSRFINKIKLRIWTNVDLPKRGSCSAKLGVRFCDGRSMLLRGWSESEKRVYQSRSDLKRQAFSLNERSKELFPESNGIVACIWFFSNVNIRCLLRIEANISEGVILRRTRLAKMQILCRAALVCVGVQVKETKVTGEGFLLATFCHSNYCKLQVYLGL